MDVPFPHLAEKRRWILAGYCMSVITCTIVCVKLLDALPLPRKWLKEAALSDVDLIRQPFEKVLAEGPSFVVFLFFNISMEKQRCKSRQGADIQWMYLSSCSANSFHHKHVFLLCWLPIYLFTFLGLCLHPGKSSTSKDSNLCFCEAHIHERLKAGDAYK